MKRLSLLLLLSFWAALTSVFAAAPQHAPRKLIVKTKPGFTADKIANPHVRNSRALLAQFRFHGPALAAANARGLDRIYVVDIDADDVEALAAQLAKDPRVEYAEPDFEVKLDATPNDPSFAQQWSLAKVQAPAAWDVATSGSGVVIGIIDSGADVTHPDLATNLWTNPGEIAGNGIDDDGNGFVDDIHGWNFAGNNANLADNNGHGTHVAGIAGAVANNGAGIAGAAWTAKLAILKGFDNGTLFIDGAIAAQQYANMMGFRITSNSWGWDNEAPSQAMQDAIAASEAAGYLFVAGAGNTARDGDAFPSFPAAYTNANVVSVAATTASDTLASYSTWGATRVDVAAPGDDILSTYPRTLDATGYRSLSGTSMATPLVAGAAALLWTARPTLTAVQVRDALVLRSDPVPALFGKSASNGRLNIFNLLDPERIAPAAITDLNVLDATYRSVTIRFTATGDDGTSGNPSRYDIRISESPITEANFASATALAGVAGAQPNGTIETMKLDGLSPSKSYYIALRAIDNAGNASALSNVVAFNSAALSIAYEDDMRGGNHGWTIAGTDGNGGPALWNILRVRNFADSPYAWCYYNDATLSYDTGFANWGTLTSPAIDLTQSRDSRLIVTHFLWTDRSTDLARIQVSVDGGAYTTLLTKDFTFYDFVTDTLDLSAYDGHTVRVRFAFDTVNAYANQYQGWVIRNVRVESATTNRAPSISMPSSLAGTEDQSISFAATASDADGDALELRWDFGDGSVIFSPSTTTTHTYTKSGTYTAIVSAYDGHNKSTATSTVTVANVNDRPVAVLEMGFGGSTFYAGVSHFVSMIGSTDEDGDPLTARVDFGDGTTGTLYDGSPSVDHTWRTAGQYTLTLVVNDGHVDSLPVSATIDVLPDKPTAVPGGPYVGSAGVAIAFDGRGSWDNEGPIVSYAWTFGDGATATGATPSHAYAADGSYNASLTVTDTDNFTNTLSFVVTIGNNLATAAIAGDYLACNGDVVTPIALTGVPPFTVTWSDGYVQTINSLPASRPVYYRGYGDFTSWTLVSMRDSRGAGTVSGQVIVRPAPLFFIVAKSGNLCNGSTVTLTATGRAKSYLWSTGATTPSITVTSPGDFTCTATYDDGCTKRDYPSVYTVNPPYLSLPLSATACASSTYAIPLTIGSNGGWPVTLVWNDGVTQTIADQNAPQTRIVSTPASGSVVYRVVSVTDRNCSGDVTGASTTINVIAKPTATVRPTNNSFCTAGTSVPVTVDLTGTAPWTVTFNDGTVVQTSSTPLTRNFTPSVTTTYSVTTVTTGSCSNTGSGSVTYTKTGGAVSGTATICRGTSTPITATLAGKAPFTVTWSDGNVQTVNSGTTATRNVSPTATTTYTATVKDANNCSVAATGSAVVTVLPAPTATLSGSGTICPSGGSVSITPTVSGNFPMTLVWSDGFTQTVSAAGQSRTVSPATTTTYTITSVNDGGTCTGSGSGSFTVTRMGTPTAVVSGGGAFCAGTNATISAALSDSGPWSITWSDGVVQTGTSSPATRSVSPSAPTTYTITSFTRNGCTGTPSGSATATPKTVTITSQPASVSIAKNTSTTLSVTASAAPAGTAVHYQWYKGASGTTNTPVGTDASTYATGKLPTSTSFWVRVTADTCTGSSVNSSTATVTVH